MQKTKDEDLKQIATLLIRTANSINAILNSAQNSQTFRQWSDSWLAQKKKNVSASQYYSLSLCLRKHISESFKDTELNFITPIMIEKELNNIGSTKMRQLTYDVFSGSLRAAYENELIASNPIDKVPHPKHRQNVGSPLSEDEIRYLLERVGKPLSLFYRFMLCTGARRGEALAVTWKDVDFKHNFIHISGTKTAKSDRIIPIFKDLKSVLDEIPRESDHLFEFDRGYVTHRFSKILGNHKLHDLRHTFATRCAECDINDDVVKEWLGHTRLVTTKRYTQIRQSKRQAEAEKFRLFD